jgi:hypothetical protein
MLTHFWSPLYRLASLCTLPRCPLSACKNNVLICYSTIYTVKKRLKEIKSSLISKFFSVYSYNAKKSPENWFQQFCWGLYCRLASMIITHSAAVTWGPNCFLFVFFLFQPQLQYQIGGEKPLDHVKWKINMHENCYNKRCKKKKCWNHKHVSLVLTSTRQKVLIIL